MLLWANLNFLLEPLPSCSDDSFLKDPGLGGRIEVGLCVRGAKSRNLLWLTGGRNVEANLGSSPAATG